MLGQVIECKKCGLEARIDLQIDNTASFAEPTEEIRKKCQTPPFDKCPNFQESIRDAVPSMFEKIRIIHPR
jgi:hypothetical protein